MWTSTTSNPDPAWEARALWRAVYREVLRENHYAHGMAKEAADKAQAAFIVAAQQAARDLP